MHIEFTFNGKDTKLRLIPNTGREKNLLQLALAQITPDCKWSVAMPKAESDTSDAYVISITLPESAK